MFYDINFILSSFATCFVIVALKVNKALALSILKSDIMVWRKDRNNYYYIHQVHKKTAGKLEITLSKIQQ